MKIPASVRNLALAHNISVGRDEDGGYFIRDPETREVVEMTRSAKPTATQAKAMIRRYLKHGAAFRSRNPSGLLDNPRKRFTAAELQKLREEFGAIQTVNPDRLEDFHRIFAGMSDATLKQVAGAEIKFLSKLALNEVARRGISMLAKKASGRSTSLEAMKAQRERLAARLEATPTNVDASRIIRRIGDLNVAIADAERRKSNPKGMSVGTVKLAWPHTFAGGTSAAPGKYGYRSESLPIGYFSISPISWPNGRHRGYVATFVNDKGAVPGGLHQTIGTFSSPAKAKAAALDTYKGILIAQAKQGAPAYRGTNPVMKSKARKNPAPKPVDHIIVAVSKAGDILAYWKGMEWGDRKDWAARWHDSKTARSAASDIYRVPRGARLAVIPENLTAAKLKAAVTGKA